MPRINKKTRIKGLPPKIQLQLKDAITGSFPAVARVASDNRTGMYRTQWDDNNTINFGLIKDIRDNIISYHRFNSGSAYNQIVPLGTTDGTSSFLMKPVWTATSNQNNSLNDENAFLRFQMHSTGVIAGFSSSAPPFTGPSNDLNATYLALTGSEYSFATGTLGVFNPGKETPVSGTTEKEFSVAFWAKANSLATFTPQAILTVGNTVAVWNSFNSLFTNLSSSVAIVASRTGNIQFRLNDRFDTTLILSTSSPVLTANTWKHVVCSYNGSNAAAGLSLFVDGIFVVTGIAEVAYGGGGPYSGLQTLSGTDYVTIGTLGKSRTNVFNGYLDEFIFFNKALNSKEAYDVYRSTAGIHRPNTFNPFSNGNYLGTGLPTNSPYFRSTLVDLITDFTGSLYTSSGSQIVKGIGDNLAHFTPGQALTPFRDSSQFAADGKNANNVFFATGSATELIGEGFNEPLWSKTKIEINLDTVTSFSLGERLGPVSGSDFLMAYYNFASQSWNPVGAAAQTTTFISQTLATSGSGVTNFFRQKAIGFAGAQNTTNASFAGTVLNGIRPVREFGFPFDGKYFVTKTGTSSSILMPMSNSINAPFLLEKIVLEFSGALYSGDSAGEWGGGATGFCSTFFFILNQKSNGFISESVVLSTDPTSFPANVTASYSVFHRSGTMDLVATLPIFTPGCTEEEWDTAYYTPSDRTAGLGDALHANKNISFIFSDHIDEKIRWTGRHLISGSVCAPSTMIAGASQYANTTINIRSGSAVGNIYRAYGSFPINRNGTNQLSSPRSFRNPALGAVSSPFFDTFNLTTDNISPSVWVVNPYILQPTDNLIFGWQAPYNGLYYDQQPGEAPPVLGFSGSGQQMPTFTIAAGPSKVILYGSYISEDKEHNDTLNQLLTSNTIHEIIG
jgi:hypothetical protein